MAETKTAPPKNDYENVALKSAPEKGKMKKAPQPKKRQMQEPESKTCNCLIF